MSVAIIVILVLLVPLVSGVLLIIFARRGGKGYPACGKCGYDVGGSVGAVTRCPECGSPFTEAGILPPRGKRNPIMLAGGIALVVVAVFVVGCVGTGLFTARRSMIQQQRAAAAAQATTQPQAAQQPATAGANEGSASESSPQQTQDD